MTDVARRNVAHDVAALDPETEVIVLGLYIQGAAMLRRLGRLGYRVCGMTDYTEEVGLASRHGHKILCPHCLDDYESWVSLLESIAQRCPGKPALIPTVDRYVLALDRAAPRLEERFRLHGLGGGLRSRLTGKRSTFELADGLGFPTPVSEPVGDRDDLLRFCRERAWPALIKPDFSFNWYGAAVDDLLGTGEHKVLRAETPEALAEAFEPLRPHSPDALIQEVIPGPDRNLIYWAGFVGEDGRVRGRVVGRKLRTTPAHFGSASLVQLEDMPEVEAQCEAFLQGLGYAGLAGIEMKIDERDGRAKLIEVNPRFGLWDEIGIPVGVDLPKEAVASLFGEEVPTARPSRFDQKWSHLGRELRAFKEYRREGSLSLLAWLRSLAPPIMVSDLPLIDDFPYAWANLREIAGTALRRVTG